MNEYVALSLPLAVCFTAAALGVLATVPTLRGWYPTLRKPSWNPPNQVFAPVWSVLYFTMAIAVWLVWRDGGDFTAPLAAFAVQLALNVLWSFVFFRWRNPAGAAAVIVALIAAIAVTIVLFARVDALAAWLLAPYLAWVVFAAALNIAIVRLNR